VKLIIIITVELRMNMLSCWR